MINTHKVILMTMVFAMTLILSATSMAILGFGDKKSEEEKNEKIQTERDDIRKMARDTLDRLYELQPDAQKMISGAAGYGVFSNFGVKILFAGSGTGKGVVINNKTNIQVFMKMIELQAGLGMGVKKFRLVWVFENRTDLDAFINSGWELGAQTSVAAKSGNKGSAFAGAMSVSPGIWLYQLTDDGLALELTAKGTKYYKDEDLN